MKPSRLVSLGLLLLLGGCPGGGASSSSTAPPNAAAASGPNLSSEALVLQVDATQPQNQAALASLARDKTKRATLRYAAERRLESQAPALAVEVAQELALDPSPSSDSFVKINSIGLLTRVKSPQAEAALSKVKASSFDNAALVAWLDRKAGGN